MNMKQLFDMAFAVTGGSQRAISTEEFCVNYNTLKDVERVRPYFEWFSNHMDVLELWQGEVVAMNADGEVFVYGEPDGYEIRLGYCNDGFTFLGTTTCLAKVGVFPIDSYPDIYWRFTAMRTADVLKWLRENKTDTTPTMSRSEQFHDLVSQTRQGYMDATINIYPDSQLQHVYAVALWVPAGAKWVAVDSTGEIYAYSDKPTLSIPAKQWLFPKGTTHCAWQIGKVSMRTAALNGGWQDSLRKISIHDSYETDALIAEDAGPAYRKMNIHKEQLFAEADGRWVNRYGLWLWVPKWTTHVAVDKDGWIYAYEIAPEMDTTERFGICYKWYSEGRCEKVGVMLKNSSASFWKTSLRTVNLIMSDTSEKSTEHVEESVEEPLKGKVRHIPIIEMEYFGETIQFPERLSFRDSKFKYIAMNKDGAIWVYTEKPKVLVDNGFRMCFAGEYFSIGQVTDKALAERMWRDSLRKIRSVS